MDIRREVDPQELRWLTPGRSWEEDSVQRAFVAFGGATWRDVKEALPREEELLAAGQLEHPELDDDGPPIDRVDQAFEVLDLGVVSAVLALNAAGCRTLYSCRGGPQHATVDPKITMRARAYTAPILLAAAASAGCGLENSDEGGGLVLYAEDVGSFPKFARSLLDLRPDLKERRVAARKSRGGVRTGRRHLQALAGQINLFPDDEAPA